VSALWVVLLILGALVVLDRVVLLVARQVAVRRVRAWLPPTDHVVVRVHGFPILTGLARRRVHTVRLIAHGVRTEGVELTELRVEARGVALRRAVGSIRRLTGSGLIEYPALSAAAPGVTLSHGGNGTLKMSAGIGAVRVSATAWPSISDDALRLNPEALSNRFGPDVPLRGLPTITYRLRELPHGLVFDVNPTERGLELALAGTDIRMR
jgi:hypothetical protein